MDRRFRTCGWPVWVLALWAHAGWVWAGAAKPSGQTVDYLRDIKPILARHCTACHGALKQTSGLRLDTAAGALAGGDSGPAVEPGKTESSLLLAAVNGSGEMTPMPPEGEGRRPLAAAEIALLRTWIAEGAAAPAEVAARKQHAHWAFRPLGRPGTPAVRSHGASNPIDPFILARLGAEGIDPAPRADRTTLVRRASLDLCGMLPSPGEVDAFLADEHPDAFERLVDRLLASPHHGERWGRHWLDLARYADSNGFTRDFEREIWLYRDWVIDAVNADMPFDRFTIEQFAGDMLPGASPWQVVATGFHRNTLINEEGGTDPEQFRIDAVADRIDTTGGVFLGLTLGCARCHEHKYDPISQRDYYRLFAFLNNQDEPKLEVALPEQVERGDLVRRAEIRRQIEGIEQELERERPELERRQGEWEAAITPEERSKLPGPVQEALMAPLPMRNPAQKKLVEDRYRMSEAARSAFPRIDLIAKLRASEPKIPTTMVLRERKKPRPTHVHKRGNFLDPGVLVEPGVPEVLHSLAAHGDRLTRLDFGRWLADARNPLTPRVVANRMWQQLFGRGIVETENDFGTQGAPPTHPELLDWLATELVARGWSTKSLLRVMTGSAAYQQSSHYRPELAVVAPANRLVGGQSRLRLEAEIVRDGVLAASGLLCAQIGGPSVHPPQPAGVFEFTQDPKPWPVEQGSQRFRRGMYTFLWRSSPYPALMVFDFPEANVTCTRRVRSNTPLQALTLANDQVFVEGAQALARRVLREAPASDSLRVEHAVRLCLSRTPDSAESQRLVSLVEQQRAGFASDPQAAQALAGRADDELDLAELAAWTAVSRVLLNLDEFVTRE